MKPEVRAGPPSRRIVYCSSCSTGWIARGPVPGLPVASLSTWAFGKIPALTVSVRPGSSIRCAAESAGVESPPRSGLPLECCGPPCAIAHELRAPPKRETWPSSAGKWSRTPGITAQGLSAAITSDWPGSRLSRFVEGRPAGHIFESARPRWRCPGAFAPPGQTHALRRYRRLHGIHPVGGTSASSAAAPLTRRATASVLSIGHAPRLQLFVRMPSTPQRRHTCAVARASFRASRPDLSSRDHRP